MIIAGGISSGETMVALSIDTAANFCAVALSDIGSGETMASISHDIGRGHAELLMDIIDQCMKQANTGYNDVGRVISTIGPGSFTGVRVGMSAARAIGLALSKPVIGVSNLQACAQYAIQVDNCQNADAQVSVILDARRNEVYFQQFQNSTPTHKAFVSSLEDLEKTHDILHSGDVILCGSGAAGYLRRMTASGFGIDHVVTHHQATAPIEVVAALGMAAPVTTSRPEPLYLRGPDAKLQHGFAVSRSSSQNTRTLV